MPIRCPFAGAKPDCGPGFSHGQPNSNAAAAPRGKPYPGCAKVRWPKLLEHERLPTISANERYRLLEAACELATEQLRYRFPGVTVPRDDPAPLPESSRALIRRLARESQERRRG